MSDKLRAMVERLSPDELIELIQIIWDRLPDDNSVPIPEAHQKELDRRLAAADADPTAGAPWNDVRARLGMKP